MTGTEAHRSGRTLLTSAGWMTGGNLVAQIASYGTLLLLARALPTTGFGTVAVGTAVVYVATLLVDGGTSGALVVHQGPSTDHLMRRAARCVLVGLLLAAGMAAAARPLVDAFALGGDPAVLVGLAACLPLYGLSVVPIAVLQRRMRFTRLAAALSGGVLLSAIAAIAALAAGAGVWALVVRQVAVHAGTAVLALVLLRVGPDPSDRPSVPGPVVSPAGPAGRDGRWFLLFGVALMATTNLDTFVVGGSDDAAGVGLYALAFTIAMTPVTQLADQLGKVLFAAAAADRGGMAARTERAVRITAVLVVPAGIAGIVTAPALLPALLGEAWAPMVPPFRVLLVAAMVVAVVNGVGEALAGGGKIAFRARWMTVRAVTTFAALLVLVPLDGIRGAAWAHLMVVVPWAAVYVLVGARMAGTSTRALGRAILPAVRAAAVQTGVTLALLPAAAVLGLTHGAALLTAGALGLTTAVGVLVAPIVRRAGS